MFHPGEVLRNRYRIESFLGRGGMADVYLALDMRRQVQVAIKVLREDLAEDPEFINRFRREAEALARLDHPYIVRFYSFERQGSVAFIVMDYVEGKTLRKRLLDVGGPLGLDEVTRILRQVGSALQYAHNEGYIHRDIKPGNILIRKDGTALLSDFGIARAAETSTMTMGPIGAPAYMSPEQIRGEELTPKTDQYSLGIVLYEMVAGRRPFRGEGGTGSASRLKRIEQQQLRETPPDPREFNPALPEGVVRVIRKALAKRPEDRWPDVMSLVRAWEKAVGATHERMVGGRILSPTVSLPEQPEQLPIWKRGPWIAVFSVGVVAVIAMILFGVAVAKPPSPTPEPETPQPVAQVESTATPTATSIPAPTTDIEAAAKATAEAMLTATAVVEQEIETVVAKTAEAFEATVTKQALEAAKTATVIARKTATQQARDAEATAAASIRLTATRRAKLTATARAKKRKPTPTPRPTPKPKKKTSSGGGVRCFEARRRHWEQSAAGGGEIAGIVYDRNGRPFNRAQVHLYIKASNWETYLPIANDGIYHFCCLAYSMQNLHVVELTGPGIRTVKTYEFYINNPNLNKVLVDFYQVSCR